MPGPTPVILSACRTPIGRFLGSLGSLSAVDLGVVAAREAISRAGIDPLEIDEAIVGNVLSAGLGQAPARQVALRAGLSSGSSSLTINMVCGSGLRAVMLAESAIRSGAASIVLAGGMESMSNAPHLLQGGRSGWKFGDRPLVDSIQRDGLACSFENWPMGMAADYTAEVHGLSRESLDEFAVESQRRAAKATSAGEFQRELAPVSITGRKGQTEIVAVDEGPRPETSLADLGRLPPAFQKTGVVTAGNSSALSDGAAFLLVASEEQALKSGAKPIARIIASSISGREPKDLFVAPVGSIQKLLEKSGIGLDQVDLFEINEAFASQMLACMEELHVDPERVNISGGAIALGHPIGASGARVLVTLINALQRRGLRRGIASLCLGGGNAVSMLVECDI